MQLNMALFEFNGRTGYMLKHDVLRRGDKKFDPFCDRIDTIIASTLSIKVELSFLDRKSHNASALHFFAKYNTIK